MDEQTIKEIKDYLFVNGILYNESTGENEKFEHVAAVRKVGNDLPKGK